MSNWITIKHNLLRDMHIDTYTTGTQADYDVGRAVVESILFNRKHNFGWNTAEHLFTTDPQVREYPLPKDFLQLNGSVFSSIETDTSTIYGKRVLRWAPMSWIRENAYRIGTDGEYLSLGVPGAFGIDPTSRKMNLSPAPTDVARIEYSYLKDPGTPWYKSNGTDWTFYAPNSDDTLADTYTNEWFDVDKGYYLILNRALYIMASRAQGGTPEMDQKAQNALRLWAEEKNRLTAEASQLVSGSEIRKYI